MPKVGRTHYPLNLLVVHRGDTIRAFQIISSLLPAALISTSQTRGGRKRDRTTLVLEFLERRDLLTGGMPTIISTGVLPLNDSTTANGSPTLQVQFSESMGASATNVNEYLLLGSTGQTIPINAATFSNNPVTGPDSIVTLTYNNSQPLAVGTYSLFIHGDQVFAANGSPLALAGQLVVANSGSNNVSTVNLPGDSTLVRRLQL